MTTTHRGPVRVAIALLLAAAFALVTVAPAHAAAFRYWGFYQLTAGTWAFAQKGPDQIIPADGAVEGWRFAVADVDPPRLPRDVLTFEEICGSTPAVPDSKRVGLVLDFGRPADSADAATPPENKAVCAVVPAKATSLDVLAVGGELRQEKGLVCAVAGYPASDCGGEVKQVSAEAKAPDTAVEIAAPAATTSAPATPTATPTPAESSAAAASATTATSGPSGGTIAGYVIAALAVVALILFLVMRARAAARPKA